MTNNGGDRCALIEEEAQLVLARAFSYLQVFGPPIQGEDTSKRSSTGIVNLQIPLL